MCPKPLARNSRMAKFVAKIELEYETNDDFVGEQMSNLFFRKVNEAANQMAAEFTVVYPFEYKGVEVSE